MPCEAVEPSRISSAFEAIALALRYAAPIEVTFHRAIDMAADPAEALGSCVRCGVGRVLSSGGAATALEGAHTLRQLVHASGGRCSVAAGGGLSEHNARALVRATGVREVHGSLRAKVVSRMAYRPAAHLAMGQCTGGDAEFEWHETDARRVRETVVALDNLDEV